MRVVSALALAAATLAMTWSGAWPFAVLVAGVVLAVSWEWLKVVRQASPDLAFAVSCFAVVAGVVLAVGHPPIWAVAVVVGGGGLAAGLAARQGASGGGFGAFFGTLYAGLPGVALAWLRAGEGYGLQAVMLVLLVVWGTDTGAYLAGRTIGGPKLWARLSPKKTWSGLIGGVSAAALVAWGLAQYLGSQRAGSVALVAIVLAIISQAGDLTESALKRRSGVKDASHLIPGHGGFMDRVDGLIFAAVAAALWAYMMDPSAPAMALLGLGRP
ncbi:MAG: phosphatidate cytidylyltransferase [Hyphomicrobiaceae bacterium]